MIRIEDLLSRMETQEASDLYLISGRPPMLRVAGNLEMNGEPALTQEHITQMAEQVMNERHRQEFKERYRADISFASATLGRFRMNIYMERGSPAIVVRRVNTRIPHFDELRLPPVVAQLALASRGLVLVTGPTGSGKSTTLAAMVSYRSQTRSGHIVTIEDPIEFMYPHDKSIVSQREVGTDCESFSLALRDALRQAPDVIVIGEIRDEESASAAVRFAETGHLVLSSLHSANASQTLERLLHFFQPVRQAEMAMQLSLNLNGIISQRLVRHKDDLGQVAVVEIMLASSRVRELLRKNDLPTIRAAMQLPASIQEGMQTFDYALFQLIQEGLIDAETAMESADSPNDLRLRLKRLG